MEDMDLWAVGKCRITICFNAWF